MNAQSKRADTSGPVLLVGALVATAAGIWTLQTARATSLSIVNDPSIVALCVNGLAVLLIPLAMWRLLRTRGLIGGLATSVLWAGVASFLLNASMEANAAESHKRWASESAVNQVDEICSGKRPRDERAKAFDPSTTTRRSVVVVRDSGSGNRPFVSAAQSLRIEEAELVACAREIETTVETCTYDGFRTMARQQVDTEVRFLSIKTGEELYRTRLAGAPPRACQDQERFSQSSASGSNRGNAPDPIIAYNEHFLAKK